MRLRSFSWSGFRSQDEPELPACDPSLAQEDEETRTSVSHYLRLADQLLFTQEEEPSGQTDDNEAA